MGGSVIGDTMGFIASLGTGCTHEFFYDDVEIRTCPPKYNVYRGGKLVNSRDDITA